jgi:DNA-binding IclR family transcriptional regulator
MIASRKRLQTLDRSTEVLEAVVQSGGLTLAEVRRRLDLGATVAHRILQTWTDLDYLAFDPRRKIYRAGIKLLSVGMRVRGALVNDDLQGRLYRVAETLSCTTNAGLLYGRQIFYIGHAESHYTSPAHLEIGTVLPAHATAIGRVLLACLPNERIYEMYGTAGVPAFGSQGSRRVDDLIRELRIVEREGYAVCYQTINEATGSVAVPLRDETGNVVAAINAIGAIERFDQATIAVSYLSALREVAKRPVKLPALFLGEPIDLQ